MELERGMRGIVDGKYAREHGYLKLVGARVKFLYTRYYDYLGMDMYIVQREDDRGNWYIHPDDFIVLNTNEKAVQCLKEDL